MASGGLNSSASAQFTTPSGSGLGVVIEVLPGNTNSPLKEVAVYCRDPYTIELSSGSYSAKGTYSSSSEEFLTFNGASSSISNPKAVNVVFAAVGSFYSKKGELVHPVFTYSEESNAISSNMDCMGALKVSYDYTGDQYQVDLTDATLIKTSRTALFLVFSSHTYSDGSVDVLSASATVSYDSQSSSSSNRIVVEEHQASTGTIDPIMPPQLKRVDVFCEVAFDTSITSGVYKKLGSVSRDFIEFNTISGDSVSVGRPGITAFSFTQSGKIIDSKGKTYKGGWVYSPESKTIVASVPGTYYGAFKVTYTAVGTQYEVDLSDADIVSESPTDRKAVFFGIINDAVGVEMASVTLDYTLQASNYNSNQQDKAKTDNNSLLHIQESKRFPSVTTAATGKVQTHFEVIPVPTENIHFVLQDVTSIRPVFIETDSNGYETPRAGPAVGSSESFEFEKYKVYHTQILNFVNGFSKTIDFLPEKIERKDGENPITPFPAYDYFGNSVNIYIKKAGDTVTEATWDYDITLQKITLAAEGIKRIVAPDEICTVDIYGRLFPCITQVVVDYSVIVSYFLAEIPMMAKKTGTDPHKWIPRDAFIWVSGVHKFSTYPFGDPLNTRRLSGTWACHSDRQAEQGVQKKPQATI